MTETSKPLLQIEQGACYALFAYDVALAINLDEVEGRIHAGTQRATLRHRRPTPRYFEYRPPPVRVSQAAEPLISGFLASQILMSMSCSTTLARS